MYVCMYNVCVSYIYDKQVCCMQVIYIRQWKPALTRMCSLIRS